MHMKTDRENHKGFREAYQSDATVNRMVRLGRDDLDIIAQLSKEKAEIMAKMCAMASIVGSPLIVTDTNKLTNTQT